MKEESKIPNEETLEAMNELKTSEFQKHAPRYSSTKELFDDLDS